MSESRTHFLLKVVVLGQVVQTKEDTFVDEDREERKNIYEVDDKQIHGEEQEVDIDEET